MAKHAGCIPRDPEGAHDASSAPDKYADRTTCSPGAPRLPCGTAHATPCTPDPPICRTMAKKRGEIHMQRRIFHHRDLCVGHLHCKARMLAPQQGAAHHTEMFPGAGKRGPSREHTRNNAPTDQRIAPQGVHTPAARPLGHLLSGGGRIQRPERGSREPDEPHTHIPTGPAGDATESYIGRPSAQVTFRNIMHWDRVKTTR